jgi:hypothetical protein
MVSKSRTVQFEANLIYLGEPLLVLLKTKKNRLIAAAIDEEDLPGSNFVCVSMSNRNWEKYIDGHVDLRFLFAYPSQRLRYSFSYHDWKEDKIQLKRYEDPFHEELLPSKGLFSREHNSEYGKNKQPAQQEELFIDGEWELNEFGKFYQKYSDLYVVTAALKNISSASSSQALRGRTQKAFQDRPFKGGSSYLHVFDDLPSCLPSEQRMTLDGINYNSPGDVRILGEMNHFSQVEFLVKNFLEQRDLISDKYKDLRKYLSSERLLTASAQSFSIHDLRAEKILNLSKSLSTSMQFSEFDGLYNVCNNNTLVASKIILAICRRLEAASLFFAEGRMSFDKP